MKNCTSHHGKVTKLTRLNGSLNGNPRFEFMFDGYKVRTPVDSSVGYAIQNFENKDAIAILGTHYGIVSLHSINKL